MPPPALEIAPFRGEWSAPVVELLGRTLWRGDPESLAAHFRWKYELAPGAGAPRGVVALSGGRVVGFRGLFATRYRFGRERRARLLLSPADTVVLSEFRGQGLSVRLGRALLRGLDDESPLLLGLSSNRASLAGYLQLGYLPLAPRFPLVRGTLAGTARYLIAALARRQAAKPWLAAPGPGGALAPRRRPEPARAGEDAEIELSDRPRPHEMAGLAAASDAGEGRIAPERDAAFYAWRFDSPLASYAFYFRRRGERTAAHLVLGASACGRRGHLLDWAGTSSDEELALLAAVIRRRRFDLLSIASYAVAPAALPALAALGFRAGHPVRRLERLRFGEPPLLVRPARETPRETDYHVAGLDVRDPGSWALLPVCSDAV